MVSLPFAYGCHLAPLLCRFIFVGESTGERPQRVGHWDRPHHSYVHFGTLIILPAKPCSGRDNVTNHRSNAILI